MEQTEFLDKNVFVDLTNLNEGDDKETVHHFSEEDFEKILDKAEHYGMGIYQIESMVDGKSHALATHEDFKKKATDPKWYKKTFLTSKMGTPGLTYSATYKVSKKLLARDEAVKIAEQPEVQIELQTEEQPEGQTEEQSKVQTEEKKESDNSQL